MNGRWTSLRTVGFLSVTVVLSACGADSNLPTGLAAPEEALHSNSRAPGQSCAPVQGSIVGNVLRASLVSGDLQGITFNIAEPQTQFIGGGVTRLNTQHRFVLSTGGSFDTEDRGMQIPMGDDLYRLRNHYRIVSGEGPMSGASGNLQVNGTLRIDFANLEEFFQGGELTPGNGDIDVTYRGEVCTPRS